MAMRNMMSGQPNIMKKGTQHLSGVQEVVVKNIEACRSLTEITTTSFGPNGMNKMVINRHGRLFVTSDAATIMNELEVEHPAAKFLVLACAMQQSEVGDGTNFVLIFSGELLKLAQQLIIMGLHTTDIIRGYELASKHVLELLPTLAVKEAKDLKSQAVLSSGVYSAIASKQHADAKVLSDLVGEACALVMPPNPEQFAVDNVRLCLLSGGTIRDSSVLHGLVFNSDVEGSVSCVEDAKVVIFNESVDVLDTDTKGTVRLTSAKELLNYNMSEEEHMEAIIKGIADMGVKVIVSGGSFGEMALHFINKFGMMAVKVPSKHMLRRLSYAVKARMCVRFGPIKHEDMGYASKVSTKEIGGGKVIIFDREDTRICTIILRSSTQNVLEDLERACDNGINVVKAMTKNATFVAGAGAVEMEAAKLTAAFGETCSGLEQYAVTKFGEAFEVFARVLGENAGYDGTAIVSKLYAAHEKGRANAGVDINTGEVCDLGETGGVYDLLATKMEGIRLATDAVTTVLRVDQIIMAKAAGGPRMPQKKQHWDDED